MQDNFSDSNSLLDTKQNTAPIASLNEFDDNIQTNNFSGLNHSSFDSSTDEVIVTTTEATAVSNLNSSEIKIVDNNIELTSQSLNQNSPEFNDTNLYAAESGRYSSENGYGLANAAEAVAKVIGEDTFGDVPDTGGKNWGADAVNAPEAWAQGYTGEGVVVAVLDTGVDYNHDDLKNNIWTNSGEIANNGKDDDGNGYIDDFYGWNFDGNNNSTIDVDGHGTHVSGTIAGTKNDFGVTGIAYDSLIMPVKVLDDTGSGSNTAVADGIYYAVDNGADVINLSLGGSFANSDIEEAVKYASEQGVTVVMAAGNSGGLLPLYPARYADEYGIAVGAIDEDKNMAQFSNRAGAETLTYVTAPGVDIYSTLPDNKYESYSGTSMATPHIAGVVALMLSANPSFDSKLIRQTLEETSSNSTQTSPGMPNIPDFFDDFILSDIFEFSSNQGYTMSSLSTDANFGNGITLNASPNINQLANMLESYTTYQQNTVGNQKNRVFSSDIESMAEEDEVWL